MQHAARVPLTAAALMIGVLAFTDSGPGPLQAAATRESRAKVDESVSYYMYANTYGPNGELVVEGTCSKTYAWKDTSWKFLPGFHDSTEHHYNVYRQVGCVYQSSMEYYDGGGVSMTAFYTGDPTGYPLGFIEADGTAEGLFETSSSELDGYVEFFAAANAGCSFYYYDIGTSRYWNSTTNVSLADLHNKTVRAVFQCSY